MPARRIWLVERVIFMLVQLSSKKPVYPTVYVAEVVDYEIYLKISLNLNTSISKSVTITTVPVR